LFVENYPNPVPLTKFMWSLATESERDRKTEVLYTRTPRGERDLWERNCYAYKPGLRKRFF